MIRYTLSCKNDHSFDSWFQSADAFEKLQRAHLITCETCGSKDVTKTIMAPAIPKKANALSDEKKTKIEELRDHVEANADYVGNSFYTEAKAMHDGDKPDRAIYGQADAKQAKALIDDGVPVLPLPFIPKKQSN